MIEPFCDQHGKRRHNFPSLFELSDWPFVCKGYARIACLFFFVENGRRKRNWICAQKCSSFLRFSQDVMRSSCFPKLPLTSNQFAIYLFNSFFCLSFSFNVISDCEIPANIVFVMDESGSIKYSNYQKEKQFVRSVYKCYKKFLDTFRFGYSCHEEPLVNARYDYCHFLYIL